MYDARARKSGSLIFTLDLKATASGYNATITDSVVSTETFQNEDGEETTVEVVKAFNTKSLFISSAEINTLFDAVKSKVDQSLPKFERDQETFKQAFLYYVQNDRNSEGKLIYDLQPEQIEIRA